MPLTTSGRSTPGAAQVGETAETEGMGLEGLSMMKARGLDKPFRPAPESGFTVSRVAVPGFASIAAGTTAVTRFPRAAPVLSTATVVARGLPFHCTTVLSTKPLPFNIKVRSTHEHEAGAIQRQREICTGRWSCRASGDLRWRQKEQNGARIVLKGVTVIVATRNGHNRNQSDSQCCPRPLHRCSFIFSGDTGRAGADLPARTGGARCASVLWG